MASARRQRMPQREQVPRGPGGFTVFVVFLLLAALCIGAGYTIGHYILSTLADNVADHGGAPVGGEEGAPPGQGGSSGEAPGGGGSSGGSVPAGGGAGSVSPKVTPLTLYSVQVGAFSARANADKAVADLGKKSYAAWVIAPSAGSSLHRVRTVAATKREVAAAAASGLKTLGYADCFVAEEKINATPVTLKGSSVDYLNKVAAGLEAASSCLRTEGEVWNSYHSGALNVAAASATVDSLITSINAAKTGLAGLSPPSDLASLGQATSEHLTAALANLQALEAFLDAQTAANKLAAETSYVALVQAYLRLTSGLGS